MKSKLLLVSIVGLALLVSGCMSITVNSKVDKDGNIENYKIVINTSSLVYGVLVEGAKKEGFSSLRESLLSNISEDMRDKVTYDEVWSGDTVSIIIEAKGFVPIKDAKLRIRKEGNYLIYEDLTFKSNKSNERNISDEFKSNEVNILDEFGKTLLSSFSLHYYLEMPGKIVESNANTVKDNKAEWHLVGADAFNARIYAKSEIPSVPGFELWIGIIGLVVGLGLSLRLK